MKRELMLAAPLQQTDRTFVRSMGRKLIYFGGWDYFRFALSSEHAPAQLDRLAEVLIASLK